jgi:hypothetical protein
VHEGIRRKAQGQDEMRSFFSRFHSPPSSGTGEAGEVGGGFVWTNYSEKLVDKGNSGSPETAVLSFPLLP